MRPNETSEADRLKTKFGSGSVHTRVFNEWAESIQEFLLTQVSLDQSEIPILAHYRSSMRDANGAGLVLGSDSSPNWMLITTGRVAWTNPDQSHYQLRHEDVEQVGWSSGPAGWPGRDLSSPPDTLVWIEDGRGHCKHYSPWLHMIDLSGKR
jgi:hypothetical protein